MIRRFRFPKTRALASLLLAGAIGLCSMPVFAQSTERPVRSQSSQSALPDGNTLARLVWSTMIALDNANRTDTYDVLHRLGTPEFQRRNPPRALRALFADLRANRVDVGRAVSLSPTYYTPPAIMADGRLRLRGGFEQRPRAVRFDLIFRQVGGGWRIDAVSVVEMDSSAPR